MAADEPKQVEWEKLTHRLYEEVFGLFSFFLWWVDQHCSVQPGDRQLSQPLEGMTLKCPPCPKMVSDTWTDSVILFGFALTQPFGSDDLGTPSRVMCEWVAPFAMMPNVFLS